MATPGDPVDTPMADAADVDAPDDTEMDGVETVEEEEKKKLEPALYESMQGVVEAIYKYRDSDGHDPSKPFHKRPNKRSFPDYYETIKEPMAMSSLKGRVNSREYSEFEEFVRDLALIWHNALVYNRPEAQAYVDATTIRGVMEAELKKTVEAGLVEADQITWPDLGEIPAADPEEEADEDAESGQEGEEDDEEAENSEAEATKPRRRARRPSTLKRGESQADAANTRRGRPPKVDTPLEARIKAVLKVIRKPKNSQGVPLIYHFEKLPDKTTLPDYYTAIRTPIALEHIKKSLKRKRYKDFDQCIADLDLMFENAKAYNEDDSGVFRAAVELKELAHKTADEERAKPDDEYAFEEGRRPKPGGITYNGKLWKVGDWVLIRNPNDVTKPIVAQVYRTWEDSVGRDWINACWYYRPEQTIHHFEKHFYPSEVLKTSQYRDHPIEDVLDKCFVMFFTRFTRGRPRGLDQDTEIFVCEARYNEEKHKINKIKTWSSCLPDEVRDKDYEMDLFDAQKRIKKVPSPLEHKAAEAKEDGTLPEPRMGADDAPPIEGGVYKGPRDAQQSPPPSPTPSPPPPQLVQPVRPISQTPGRETPIRPHRRSEVDSAMASATRAFGASNANPSQTNFIQQRQPQTSASPAPQQQYQQHQGSASYGNQHAAPGSPSSQRVNYGSYRPESSQQRPGTTGVSGSQRPSDVLVLPPAANAAIPPEVREQLQTNDQGEVLFFSHPPQPRPQESRIPTNLRTSLKYRIERIRQRVQKVNNAIVDANRSSGVNGITPMNGDTGKRAADDITESAAKRARTSRAYASFTEPITIADIDPRNPETSIDSIDPERVDPLTNAQYIATFGVDYKTFLKSVYLRNQQLWAAVMPASQVDQTLERSIKQVAASVEQSLRADAQKQDSEDEKAKHYFWRTRDIINKQPEFFLEDKDPLYCGLSWTGPNPYPFNGGGSTVTKRD